MEIRKLCKKLRINFFLIDNIKLAIEMLSNVNLEKHGLTIALLLNRWKDRMSWGQGNTYSQAFKTLDRYFRNKGIDWKKDFRSLGADLYNNYKKEEDREIISRFVIDNLNKYLGYNQKLYYYDLL